MEKTLAALAAATLMAVGVAQPASAQESDVSLSASPIIQTFVGIPLIMSSFLSSFIAPQCSLLDTRGC